jgi:hypothetical protein
VTTARAKAGSETIATSSTGVRRPRWRRTKTTPAATPTTRATAAATDGPSAAVSLTAHTAGTTAPSESTTLAGSTGSGSTAVCSGSRNGPTSSSSTITGTPIRKTEPHQNCSSSTPPTSGPIALPAPRLPIQTAIAVVRSRGSSNMVRISDSVEGISVAPATPSRARAAISSSGVGANAAPTDTTPNAAAPTSSSRRRPVRSPRVPMVSRRPAIRNP